MIAAARIAGVHDMILRLPDGYATTLGGAAQPLSGGQIQRLGLARAVFGAPKVIVLDEPNSNLDAGGDEALARAIATMRAQGSVVVVMAHRPSAIAAVNKVLILHNGTMAQFGDKDEVLAAATRPAPAATPLIPAVAAAGLAAAAGSARGAPQAGPQHARQQAGLNGISGGRLQDTPPESPDVMSAQSGAAQSGAAQSGVAQSGVAQSGVAQSGVAGPLLRTQAVPRTGAAAGGQSLAHSFADPPAPAIPGDPVQGAGHGAGATPDIMAPAATLVPRQKG